MNISRTEVFQASAVSCGLSARGGSYIKNYDIQSHKNKLGVEKILLEISWKGDTLKYRISYKNYSLNCSGATAVENVKADEVSNKKVLINGQLFILHDGKIYNASGFRVQ